MKTISRIYWILQNRAVNCDNIKKDTCTETIYYHDAMLVHWDLWWNRHTHGILLPWVCLDHHWYGMEWQTVSLLFKALIDHLFVCRFKYPLAVVNKMLTTFGKNQGSRYNTGCQFKTMLNNSSIGPLTWSLNYTSLIDAFHGHACQHLGQLSHLQKGLGIEDLGMCEWVFSQLNAHGYSHLRNVCIPSSPGDWWLFSLYWWHGNVHEH